MLKTKDGRILNVEELSADKVNLILQQLLPDFAEIMESYDLNDFKFYKASYPFGSNIINNNKCYLPLADGSSIEFNDSTLPDSLAQDLNYNPINEDPLAVVLSKNSELFMPSGDRIMSHAIIHPGELFGIPRAVDPKGIPPSSSSLIWNLNAGSRYLFTLSRATSKVKHSKLQKSHEVREEAPSSSEKQWAIFVEIARYEKSSWSSEILYFPRKLIDKLKEHEWSKMANHLQLIRRASYNVWHNTMLLWDASFNSIEHRAKISHYSSYAFSTARQLFLIAANSALGFRPATNEDSAPISLIKDVYNNIYGLTEDGHSDVIMEPADFKSDKDQLPIYYSLNYPLLAKHNPETFKGKSLITLLDNVERITRAYQRYIPTNEPSIPSLIDIVNSTEFAFFHSMSDQQVYKNILNNAIIAEEDSRFIKNQHGEFAEHSQFFKGCIRISHKKS